MARPKGITKKRATFTIDEKVIEQLEKVIKKSQYSQFVENAIKNQLKIIDSEK